VARPLGQAFDGRAQPAALHLPGHGVRRVRGPRVLREVSELGSALLGVEGLVQADHVRDGALGRPHLPRFPPEAFGYLLLGRVPPELRRELARGAGDLPDLLGHVYRYPDRVLPFSSR
jgi:hypothetical protein